MPLVERIIAEAQKFASGHSQPSSCSGPQQPQYYPHHQQQQSQYQQYPPPPQQQWPGYGQQDHHMQPPAYGYPPAPAGAGGPGPYYHPQGFHHAPSPQPPPQHQQQFPAPPPEKLLLKETGRKAYELVGAGSRQPAYRVAYSSSLSSQNTVRVTRAGGQGGGEQAVGMATTHAFTTSKVDMEIYSSGGVGGNNNNNNNNNNTVRFKKSFDSLAGQGHLEWKSEKGNLVCYGGGRGGMVVLATFYLDKGPDSAKRQSGEFDFGRGGAGLGRAQIDEIVVSGLAELERRRYAVEAAKGASSGGSEVAAALVG